jgi:hypothetical protein
MELTEFIIEKIVERIVQNEYKSKLVKNNFTNLLLFNFKYLYFCC